MFPNILPKNFGQPIGGGIYFNFFFFTFGTVRSEKNNQSTLTDTTLQTENKKYFRFNISVFFTRNTSGIAATNAPLTNTDHI
jgi:hypothetical protein